MAEAASQSRKSIFLKFTAVDLITIAIFAVLVRTVFYYAYKALYVAFPLNQIVFPFFMAFTMSILLVLVPKQGTVLLWTITWQGINFFFQGESPLYLLMYIPIPLITEAVFFFMKRYGADLGSSLIGNMVFQVGHMTATYLAIVYVFFMDWSFQSFLVLLAVGVLVSTPLGVLAGYQLGNRLKQMIG